MEARRGNVVWFTGLSGSGKTTLCHSIADQLRRRMIPVHILDGDEVRHELCSDLGFTVADRLENVRRITFVARTLAKNGITVLVAVISPLHIMRENIRLAIPDLLEVFVDAPLAICEQRDPKGLYKRARSGEIQHLTGIDSPFERPLQPDIICQTDKESITDSAAKVLNAILFVPGSENPSLDKRRRTIAVDFDGVIADYDGWRGANVLGPPRSDVISAISFLKSEGWKVIVHTTRSSEDIREYLDTACFPYDEVNCNSDYSNAGTKPVATVYWDDRAVRYSGDALRDLELIRDFRTWNNRS